MTEKDATKMLARLAQLPSDLERLREELHESRVESRADTASLRNDIDTLGRGLAELRGEMRGHSNGHGNGDRFDFRMDNTGSSATQSSSTRTPWELWAVIATLAIALGVALHK